jgi:predicted HTH transcriptional regulator
VGSTNRRAGRELIGELRRFARGEAYDEQPVPDLDSEAIDFRAAPESFAAFRRFRRTDLQTRRLVTSHQGRRVPTVGGLLLFGKRREESFPDAWIQVGRFQGIDRSHIVDRAEIRTYLVPAVDEAIAFVEKHALHTERTSGVFVAKSIGAYRPSRFAKRSSMPWCTPTTPRRVRQSASPSSMTAWGSRIPGFFPSV